MLVDVAISDWRPSLEQARSDGLDFLDVLTAVDRGPDAPQGERFELLAHVVDIKATGFSRDRWIRSWVGAEATVESCRDLYPAAHWHEREIAEMFGLDISGAAGDRLLLGDDAPDHPLRKDVLLEHRLARPWPGAEEPGVRKASSRRRLRPAGVPDGWVPPAAAQSDPTTPGTGGNR